MKSKCKKCGREVGVEHLGEAIADCIAHSEECPAYSVESPATIHQQPQAETPRKCMVCGEVISKSYRCGCNRLCA
jgi:hypothetical protein